MSTFTSDNITIFYSNIPSGQPTNQDTVLLISGLGSQHTSWRPEFKHRLAAAGYRVLTMDNRDVGDSSHMTETVAINDVIAKALAGEQPEVPYLLSDMADDCDRLLSHLGIDAAHIVGISMGGMIAQTFAIRHPQRTLSLTSIMSTTGDPVVGEATPEGQASMFMPPPLTRIDAIESSMAIGRILSTDGAFEEETHREDARSAIGRNHDSAGVARQFAAIIASGDRTDQLRELDIPTLVIHGSGDPLIGQSGGVATAEAIPDAQLLIIDRMGHDLPVDLWQTVLSPMVKHFDSVTDSHTELRILPGRAEHAEQLADIAARAFSATTIEPPDVGGDGCHELWEDGVLVGGCYTRYEGAGNWVIQSVFIDPRRQRRGLGSTLLGFVERSHPWIKQISVDSPQGLQSFWRASGYRATEHDGADTTRFRRDSWQLPWVPTTAEAAEAATALANDIESGNLHGIAHLDDETAAQFSDMLTGYVDELEGRLGEGEPSPVAEGRRWMRTYLRTFRGTPWMSSGGHTRMMVVHSMLRRLSTPAKNRLLDLRGLNESSPPGDDAGIRIWEDTNTLLSDLANAPKHPDLRAVTNYLIKLRSELIGEIAPDLIFGGGSNTAVLPRAERISGEQGKRLAAIIQTVTSRAEAIYQGELS